MTDPREILARIRKQADAATPGPWEHEPPPGPGEDPMRPICVYPKEDGGTLAYVQPLEADAELIASSRTIIPALLDALEPLLERHSPHEDSPDEDHLVCGGCYNADYGEYDPYPCEDVEIITKALKKVSNALA